MRIAIVEDNEALAHAIAYRLRDRGHAVDVLHDGQDADRFLSREGADLVEPEFLGDGVPPGEIDRQFVDATKLTELTGWKPQTTLGAGITEAVEWYRARAV